MLESLFGAETPLAVRFFVAFIVVFALIGLVAWLVRRFGSGALGSTGSRGRAPRLAVIEAGAVDGRRKLVLIRRDNIEHLIMIGGPTDIVVEANIVRGQNATREAAPRAEPRAALPEEPVWPIQPEVAPRPARPVRQMPAVEETMHWPSTAEPQMPAAPAPKRPRAADALSGLAAELSTRPTLQPEAEIAPARPAPKIEPRVEPKIETKIDLKIEPTVEPRAPQKPAAQSQPADIDPNLADMAQRLEAALRRPAPAPAAAPAAPAPHIKPAPEKVTVVDKLTAPAKPAPAKKADNVFGSLEEEMASLLGRPPGKT
jgi:hypothetical protein